MGDRIPLLATTQMKHKIYIGDHPTIENPIEGKNILPQDTRFAGEGTLVFNTLKNINKYLKYSSYPIVVLLNSTRSLKYEHYKKFDVIQSVWSIRNFVEHIFFNPDREFVYNKLVDFSPPTVSLFMWIKKNAIRVYNTIPEILYTIDEIVVKGMSEYFYVLVCFRLKCSTNVIKLKWA